MAISLDAISGNNTSDGTVHSSARAHTIGAGLSNSALFVLVAGRRGTTEGGMPVSGVTFAGTALTLAKAQAGTDSFATRLNGEIWYLPNPPAGLGTYTVTYVGTVGFSNVFGVSLAGVDLASPIGVTAGSARDGATDASPVSNILSGVATDSWILNAIYHKVGSDLSVGQGTAVGTSGPNANGDRAGGAYQGPVGVTTGTASWTYASGSDGWLMASAEIKAFSSLATRNTTPMMMMGVGN